jgi:hypothetical protein
MNLDELFAQQLGTDPTQVFYMLQEGLTVHVRKHQLSAGPVTLIEPDLAGWTYNSTTAEGWPLFLKDAV